MVGWSTPCPGPYTIECNGLAIGVEIAISLLVTHVCTADRYTSLALTCIQLGSPDGEISASYTAYRAESYGRSGDRLLGWCVQFVAFVLVAWGNTVDSRCTVLITLFPVLVSILLLRSQLSSRMCQWRWAWSTGWRCTENYCGLNWGRSSYRQHCALRKLPVFNVLRGRFWGFSPCRGDKLHRCVWNLAWRKGLKVPSFGPLLHAKFHPYRCNDGRRTPKTEIFTQIWSKCGI